jgi:uncharacterized protein (TIGR02265 family)
MPVDRSDLAARLAAATPQDTVRGLVFNAVFAAVEAHLGAPAALACDPLGKARRTDFFSFPAADFLGVVSSAADALEPELGSTDRALFEFGDRALANVLRSKLGATMLALAGKSVRGFLAQAPAGYRGTVSYGERRLEWVGERHARFTFTRDFLFPPYHRGVLTAAVEALGGREARVSAERVATLYAVYDVTWA